MNNQGVTPSRRKDNHSDIQFKVIIIGDSAVGKSCFLARYVKGIFVEDYRITIGNNESSSGAQFQTKTVEIDDYKIKLQIWDTAGQQSFRSIVKAFYRGSAAVILVYNLANKASFDHLDDWLREASQNAPPTAMLILVGTHSDLVNERKVSKAEIEHFKRQNNILLSFQTSAKDDSNVTIAFEQIAAQSFDNYKKKMEKRRTSFTPPPQKNMTLNSTVEKKRLDEEKKEGCC